MYAYIYIYAHPCIYIYTYIYILPLFVTLKKVYDRKVENKYGLYLLLGVIIYNLIDYVYIYICIYIYMYTYIYVYDEQIIVYVLVPRVETDKKIAVVTR